METCPSCGRLAWLDVAELLVDTRQVVLDACCEDNLAGWIASVGEFSRREVARWMLEKTGLVVNNVLVSNDTLHWTLDYGLDLRPVTFDEAREFIRQHHRHCDPPTGWKFGAAVFNGNDQIGVMTAGRPVSRILDAKGYLEITRVCVSDMGPQALKKNACSMLYGYACREAFKRGHDRIVTYSRRDEEGASLRAAGFVPVATSKGGEWNRPGRPRRHQRNTVPKLRWERWKKQRLPVQRLLAFGNAQPLREAA